MNWGGILQASFDTVIEGTLGLFENLLLDIAVPMAHGTVQLINAINNDLW